MNQVLTAYINCSHILILGRLHCHRGLREKASTAPFCPAQSKCVYCYHFYAYGMLQPEIKPATFWHSKQMLYHLTTPKVCQDHLHVQQPYQVSLPWKYFTLQMFDTHQPYGYYHISCPKSKAQGLFMEMLFLLLTIEALPIQ